MGVNPRDVSCKVISQVLTIYTNSLGENLVHKHKTVKFDVVERTAHHNVSIRIS